MTPVYLHPSSTSPFSPYNINIVQHATEEDLRLKLLNTSLPLPYQSLANSSSLISSPTFFHSSDNQRRTYGSSNTTNFGDQALLYNQRADDKLVWHGEPSRDQACTSETLVRPVVNVSSSDEYTDKINLEDHVRNIGEPRGSRLKQKTTSVMDHQIPDQKFQSVHHVDFQLQENNMGETSSNILAAVSNNNSSGGSTTASGVRVCSDCSTSTTPLWRSGPRGPKSLCNACGIRQRKARRAMAEFETAAAANASAVCTNRSPTVATTTASSMSKVKDKKPRGNHNSNKRKLDTASTASLTCYKTKNKQKAASPQSVLLPQDVAEAAMLLMELSSGLMNHSS